MKLAKGDSSFVAEEAIVPMQHQKMMFGAGLRGAVALALVMGMPSSKVDVFASATLFIIMFTNFLLGGATGSLIQALGVHSEQAGNMAPEDLEFTDKEAQAVFAWYEFENRWLPFLKLAVDKPEAERMRQVRFRHVISTETLLRLF